MKVAFSCKVLADSVSPEGSRLTTMELTYPRCIHSEFMTHRRFSRNAASSRAIPIEKMIKAVEDDPFVPKHWGQNQKGMQAGQEVDTEGRAQAVKSWLAARDYALIFVTRLNEVGIHKQIVNRLLEPFSWITVICSGTEDAWANFFALRVHTMAEPHLQIIARKAFAAYHTSAPAFLNFGHWHLPLVGFEGDEHLSDEDRPKISAARCARVSYLTHEGVRDVQADKDLFDRLAGSRPIHASALEHPAVCRPVDQGGSGNFAPGWGQLRKTISGESVDRMSDVLPE